MNPTHTIPTLVDDGFALYESHAILIYLAEKYGKDDALYPKDLKQRAIINQRLFFDTSVLYQRHSDYFYPQAFYDKPIDAAKLKPLQDALEFLNGFLAASKWVAGGDKNATIADYSLAVTVKAISLGGLDFTPYPNLVRWYAQCKTELPHWTIVEENLEELKPFFDKIKK